MDINDIIKPENRVYKRPALLNDTHMHYCPGCSHGVVHKLIAEILEEMNAEDKAIGVAPVGCAVFAYNISTLTSLRPHTVALLLLQLQSSDCSPTNWYSLIRATATWQP